MRTYKDVKYVPDTDFAIDGKKMYTNIMLKKKDEYMLFDKAFAVFVQFNKDKHGNIPLGQYC
jgi:hypothetical protein